MWKKFSHIPLSPTQKRLRSVPYMARRKIFQGAYYIQDTHWGTHFIYIQNIHLELHLEITFQHTLELYPFRVHALAHIYTHQTSIGLAPFTHLSTHSLARSLTYLPHPCLHLHSQAFYHIIITFRTYIRITFIFHQITYLALTFLFTL